MRAHVARDFFQDSKTINISKNHVIMYIARVSSHIRSDSTTGTSKFIQCCDQVIKGPPDSRPLKGQIDERAQF